MKLYRSYTGEYVIYVDTVIDVDSRETKIIYQNLERNNFYTMSQREFFAYVADSDNNTTGQKLRYEQVTDFENQLNMITTERLVKELLIRHDSPIQGLDIEGIKDEKIFLSEYVVGLVITPDSNEGETHQTFMSNSAYRFLEEAQNKLEKLRGRYEIMKRVYIRVESNK